MSRESIKDAESFDRLLGDHHGFADAIVVALTRVSEDSIRLVISEKLAGSWRAGAEETVRDVTLTVLGTRAIAELPEAIAGHCSEGLQRVDVPAGVGFEIDVPGLLRVQCAEIEVEAGESRQRLVEPLLSDSNISCVVKSACVPEPHEWIGRFSAQGIEVGWRYYAGTLRDAPFESGAYEGWFLVEAQQADKNPGGLFFRECRVVDGQMFLTLEGLSASRELWGAAKLILAGLPDLAEVHCGNCVFAAAEGRAWLLTGALPSSFR